MEEEEEERMEEDNKDGDDDEIFDNGQDLAIFENIRTLGWVGKQGILMQPLGAALHKAILTKVRSAIAGEFEEEGLYEEVWSWAEHTVQGWLEDLVGTEALEKEQWVDKLQRCTAECFCLVRFDEIFDIVAEFPDSKPCVIELRKVLVETKIHSQLGDALRASLVKRLNHPGANTSQIIGK